MAKDKLLPEGFVLDEVIADEIKACLIDGSLSCVNAHKVAQQLGVTSSVIGHTADALGIRLNKCQLGLFGYPNKKGWNISGVTELEAPDDFTQALRAETADQNQITCLDIWDLAAQYSVSRMQAGYIAEKLDISIIKCQLGAF